MEGGGGKKNCRVSYLDSVNVSELYQFWMAHWGQRRNSGVLCIMKIIGTNQNWL